MTALSFDVFVNCMQQSVFNTVN